MSLNISSPDRGKILIAEPLLGDPNFERSIILLADHNEEGSVGFILTRKVEIDFDELVIDFPPFEAHIFEGGPVQDDNLFFIHRKGNLLPGSEKIIDGVFWGGDLETLKELIAVGLIGPDDIRFYLGYSGWSSGQLKEELDQKSWLVADSDPSFIFSENADELWSLVMKQLGGEYPLWHNAPLDPNLN
jgi:putative transcriptional regulator